MTKLTVKQIIACIIIIISVFLDAMRDANIIRVVDWWSWHCIKWGSMFSLWIGILWLNNFFTKHSWRWIVVLAGLAILIWQLGYNIEL